MKDLKKSKAGKLGIEKARATINQMKSARVEQYQLNPNLCKTCNSPLPYEKKNYKFCSRSCAATNNNAGLNRYFDQQKEIVWSCKCCGKETISRALRDNNRRYCSIKCQRKLTKAETLERLKSGKINNRGLIRSALIREFGRKCWECNLEEWRGHPIPIEVDHKDGNAGNNEFDNLRLLCPNCHGITPTWKGRNKGNGRAARGLPLF